jgi:tape measure domain-containing protein
MPDKSFEVDMNRNNELIDKSSEKIDELNDKVVAPQVDIDELRALNEQLDKSVANLKEVINFYKSNPIVANVIYNQEDMPNIGAGGGSRGSSSKEEKIDLSEVVDSINNLKNQTATADDHARIIDSVVTAIDNQSGFASLFKQGFVNAIGKDVLKAGGKALNNQGFETQRFINLAVDSVAKNFERKLGFSVDSIAAKAKKHLSTQEIQRETRQEIAQKVYQDPKKAAKQEKQSARGKIDEAISKELANVSQSVNKVAEAVAELSRTQKELIARLDNRDGGSGGNGGAGNGGGGGGNGNGGAPSSPSNDPWGGDPQPSKGTSPSKPVGTGNGGKPQASKESLELTIKTEPVTSVSKTSSKVNAKVENKKQTKPATSQDYLNVSASVVGGDDDAVYEGTVKKLKNNAKPKNQLSKQKTANLVQKILDKVLDETQDFITGSGLGDVLEQEFARNNIDIDLSDIRENLKDLGDLTQDKLVETLPHVKAMVMTSFNAVGMTAKAAGKGIASATSKTAPIVSKVTKAITDVAESVEETFFDFVPGAGTTKKVIQGSAKNVGKIAAAAGGAVAMTAVATHNPELAQSLSGHASDLLMGKMNHHVLDLIKALEKIPRIGGSVTEIVQHFKLAVDTSVAAIEAATASAIVAAKAESDTKKVLKGVVQHQRALNPKTFDTRELRTQNSALIDSNKSFNKSDNNVVKKMSQMANAPDKALHDKTLYKMAEHGEKLYKKALNNLELTQQALSDTKGGKGLDLSGEFSSQMSQLGKQIKQLESYIKNYEKVQKHLESNQGKGTNRLRSAQEIVDTKKRLIDNQYRENRGGQASLPQQINSEIGNKSYNLRDLASAHRDVLVELGANLAGTVAGKMGEHFGGVAGQLIASYIAETLVKVAANKGMTGEQFKRHTADFAYGNLMAGMVDNPTHIPGAMGMSGAMIGGNVEKLVASVFKNRQAPNEKAVTSQESFNKLAKDFYSKLGASVSSMPKLSRELAPEFANGEYNANSNSIKLSKEILDDLASGKPSDESKYVIAEELAHALQFGFGKLADSVGKLNSGKNATYNKINAKTTKEQTSATERELERYKKAGVSRQAIGYERDAKNAARAYVQSQVAVAYNLKDPNKGDKVDRDSQRYRDIVSGKSKFTPRPGVETTIKQTLESLKDYAVGKLSDKEYNEKAKHYSDVVSGNKKLESKETPVTKAIDKLIDYAANKTGKNRDKLVSQGQKEVTEILKKLEPVKKSVSKTVNDVKGYAVGKLSDSEYQEKAQRYRDIASGRKKLEAPKNNTVDTIKRARDFATGKLSDDQYETKAQYYKDIVAGRKKLQSNNTKPEVVKADNQPTKNATNSTISKLLLSLSSLDKEIKLPKPNINLKPGNVSNLTTDKVIDKAKTEFKNGLDAFTGIVRKAATVIKQEAKIKALDDSHTIATAGLKAEPVTSNTKSQGETDDDDAFQKRFKASLAEMDKYNKKISNYNFDSVSDKTNKSDRIVIKSHELRKSLDDAFQAKNLKPAMRVTPEDVKRALFGVNSSQINVPANANKKVKKNNIFDDIHESNHRPLKPALFNVLGGKKEYRKAPIDYMTTDSDGRMDIKVGASLKAFNQELKQASVSIARMYDDYLVMVEEELKDTNNTFIAKSRARKRAETNGDKYTLDEKEYFYKQSAQKDIDDIDNKVSKNNPMAKGVKQMGAVGLMELIGSFDGTAFWAAMLPNAIAFAPLITGIAAIKRMTNGFGELVIASGKAYENQKNLIRNSALSLSELDAAMKNTSDAGSSVRTKRANEAMEYTKNLAVSSGTRIDNVRKLYTGISGATIGSRDPNREINNRQISEGLSIAAASNGLSEDATQRMVNAVTQMLGKGKIQAEELRGQLAEALPSAIGIMADSLGVTTSKLMEMSKAGELISANVLPAFAAKLKEIYGSEEQMTAYKNSFEGLGNAAANAQQKIAETIGNPDSGLSGIMKLGIKMKNAMLDAVAGLGDVLNNAILSAIAGVGAVFAIGMQQIFLSPKVKDNLAKVDGVLKSYFYGASKMFYPFLAGTIVDFTDDIVGSQKSATQNLGDFFSKMGDVFAGVFGPMSEKLNEFKKKAEEEVKVKVAVEDNLKRAGIETPIEEDGEAKKRNKGLIERTITTMAGDGGAAVTQAFDGPVASMVAKGVEIVAFYALMEQGLSLLTTYLVPQSIAVFKSVGETVGILAKTVNDKGEVVHNLSAGFKEGVDNVQGHLKRLSTTQVKFDVSSVRKGLVDLAKTPVSFSGLKKSFESVGQSANKARGTIMEAILPMSSALKGGMMFASMGATAVMTLGMLAVSYGKFRDEMSDTTDHIVKENEKQISKVKATRKTLDAIFKDPLVLKIITKDLKPEDVEAQKKAEAEAQRKEDERKGIQRDSMGIKRMGADLTLGTGAFGGLYSDDLIKPVINALSAAINPLATLQKQNDPNRGGWNNTNVNSLGRNKTEAEKVANSAISLSAANGSEYFKQFKDKYSAVGEIETNIGANQVKNQLKALADTMVLAKDAMTASGVAINRVKGTDGKEFVDIKETNRDSFDKVAAMLERIKELTAVRTKVSGELDLLKKERTASVAKGSDTTELDTKIKAKEAELQGVDKEKDTVQARSDVANDQLISQGQQNISLLESILSAIQQSKGLIPQDALDEFVSKTLGQALGINNEGELRDTITQARTGEVAQNRAKETTANRRISNDAEALRETQSRTDKAQEARSRELGRTRARLEGEAARVAPGQQGIAQASAASRINEAERKAVSSRIANLEELRSKQEQTIDPTSGMAQDSSDTVREISEQKEELYRLEQEGLNNSFRAERAKIDRQRALEDLAQQAVALERSKYDLALKIARDDAANQRALAENKRGMEAKLRSMQDKSLDDLYAAAKKLQETSRSLGNSLIASERQDSSLNLAGTGIDTSLIDEQIANQQAVNDAMRDTQDDTLDLATEAMDIQRAARDYQLEVEAMELERVDFNRQQAEREHDVALERQRALEDMAVQQENLNRALADQGININELDKFTREAGNGLVDAIKKLAENIASVSVESSGSSASASDVAGADATTVTAISGNTGNTTGAHLDIRATSNGTPVSEARLKEITRMFEVSGNGHSGNLSTQRITSGYGQRNIGLAGASTNHQAHDFGLAEGTKIKFKGKGTASYKEDSGNGGNTLSIKLDTGEIVQLLHLKGVEKQGSTSSSSGGSSSQSYGTPSAGRLSKLPGLDAIASDLVKHPVFKQDKGALAAALIIAAGESDQGLLQGTNMNALYSQMGGEGKNMKGFLQYNQAFWRSQTDTQGEYRELAANQLSGRALLPDSSGRFNSKQVEQKVKSGAISTEGQLLKYLQNAIPIASWHGLHESGEGGNRIRQSGILKSMLKMLNGGSMPTANGLSDSDISGTGGSASSRLNTSRMNRIAEAQSLSAPNLVNTQAGTISYDRSQSISSNSTIQEIAARRAETEALRESEQRRRQADRQVQRDNKTREALMKQERDQLNRKFQIEEQINNILKDRQGIYAEIEAIQANGGLGLTPYQADVKKIEKQQAELVEPEKQAQNKITEGRLSVSAAINAPVNRALEDLAATAVQKFDGDMAKINEAMGNLRAKAKVLVAEAEKMYDQDGEIKAFSHLGNALMERFGLAEEVFRDIYDRSAGDINNANLTIQQGIELLANAKTQAELYQAQLDQLAKENAKAVAAGQLEFESDNIERRDRRVKSTPFGSVFGDLENDRARFRNSKKREKQSELDKIEGQLKAGLITPEQAASAREEINGVKESIIEMNAALVSSNPLAGKLSDSLMNLVKNGGSLGDVFSSLADTILDSMLKVVTDAIAVQFTSMLSGIFGGMFGIKPAASPVPAPVAAASGGYIPSYANGRLPNYSLGGALSAEDAQDIGTPFVAVINSREAILSAKNNDAQTFAKAKQDGSWDALKASYTGSNNVSNFLNAANGYVASMNYANGYSSSVCNYSSGYSNSVSRASANMVNSSNNVSGGTSNYITNSPVKIMVQKDNPSGKSSYQIAKREQERLDRAKR